MNDISCDVHGSLNMDFIIMHSGKCRVDVADIILT